jgi:hypothetical protein
MNADLEAAAARLDARRAQADATVKAHRTAALAAFIEQKNEIDRLLALIAEESANHFGVDPETVTWADRDGLARITALLTEAKDILKQEGEYA